MTHEDNSHERLECVYLVEHYYEDERGDHVKTIGVYDSQSKAQAAVAKVDRCPGFVKYPDGFSISKYPLNKGHWLEGFETST